MKLIKNNIIPFKGYSAINLFGYIFYKKDKDITPRLLNHESIHTRQMKELLYIPFYVFYMLEWVIRLIQYKFDLEKAYRNISFEREAHSNDWDGEYLDFRKRLESFKYILRQCQ